MCNAPFNNIRPIVWLWLSARQSTRDRSGLYPQMCCDTCSVIITQQPIPPPTSYPAGNSRDCQSSLTDTYLNDECLITSSERYAHNYFYKEVNHSQRIELINSEHGIREPQGRSQTALPLRPPS